MKREKSLSAAENYIFGRGGKKILVIKGLADPFRGKNWETYQTTRRIGSE